MFSALWGGALLREERRANQLEFSVIPDQALIIGGILGFVLAGRLLRYGCDRCLFRFRDTNVRAKGAPLLLA